MQPDSKYVQQKKPARLIQLDFLRGVAILLVLMYHGGALLPIDRSGAARPVAEFIERFGWTGVDLFFVLSGYLIGGLLFKELKRTGTLDVRRFIVRRGLKIWPSYYLLLGWLIFQEYRSQHALKATLVSLVPNLLHIQNYASIPSELIFTWSLAVEEHFYLALPLLLLFLSSRPKRHVHLFPWIAGILAVVCPLLRWHAMVNHPLRSWTDFSQTLDWVWHVYTPSQLRADELMGGVLLSYITYFKPEMLASLRDSSRKRWLLCAVGVLLISPMAFLSKLDPTVTVFVHTIGISMLYMGYACILMACVHSVTADHKPGKFFRSRPALLISWIGFYSYPIYLWHWNQGRDRVLNWLYLGSFGHLHGAALWVTAMALYLSIAIGFGMLFSKLIEMPLLKMRNRFFPERVQEA